MVDTFRDRVSALQGQLGEAKDVGDAALEIETLLEIGHLANEHGDRGLAHLHFKLAMKVIQGTAVHRERLHEAIGELGVLARRAKQLPEAIEFYDRAIAAAQEHAGEGDVAHWLGKKGAALRMSGDLEGAGDLHRRAHDKYAALGDAGWAGLAEQEGQLGLDALAEENVDLAEEHYLRAFEIARAAEDLSAINTWGTNLGNSAMRRRCHLEADHYYAPALEAARTREDESAIANTLRCWVQSLRLAHRNREAADLQLAQAREVKNPSLAAGLTWQALADLERDGDWKRVREVGQRLATDLHDGGADPERVDEVAQKVDDAVARLAASETFVAARADESKDDPIRVLDHFVVRQMARLEPQNDVAGMEDVAHLLADAKAGLRDFTPASWRSLLSELHLMQRAPADAMLALCKEGQAARSLEISQRLKAPGFALNAIRHASRNAPPHREAAHYLEALVRLQQAVLELDQPPGPNSAVAIEHVRAAGLTLRERGEALRQRDPILHARLGGVVPPEDLIDAFPAADPVGIVDLFVSAAGTLLHVIFRQGPHVRIVPSFCATFTAADAEQLTQLWIQSHMTAGLGERQAPGLDHISKTLHDKLMCGLAKQMVEWRLPQLILIPDLLTRHLPFHLSWVCGKEIEIPGVPTEHAEYLCEALPVEYAPCLQAVAVSQYLRRPRTLRKIFALSDPFGDLAGAKGTASWLASELPKELEYESVEGQDANLENLARGLAEADILVIGTHGKFDARNPDESHLVFHDGPWKMLEMMNRPVAAASQVIILSACEVGAVATTIDDSDASGVPGALVASGAASVLASLWPVEDISMGFLVERFLQHLSHKGYRPAAALFRAVRDLRRLTKAQCLKRCEDLLERMEADGTLEQNPQHWVFVDNLAEWIRALDETAHPFASPAFWGGVVTVGSGWGAAAGAVVGSAAQVTELATFLIDEAHARDLLAKGRYAEARETVERYLDITDGDFRAKTLCIVGEALWRERGPWDSAIAGRKATQLLGKARVLAMAEQDVALVAAVDAALADIETHIEPHASSPSWKEHHV